MTGPATDFTISIEGKWNTQGRPVDQCQDCNDRCRTCVLARRTVGNGTKVVWIQCATCKRGVRALGAAAVLEAQKAGCTIREWDDAYRINEDAQWASNQNRFEQRRLEDEIKRRKAYNEHLRSEKWNAIRAKVLKRDGGLCQGCLERPAVHVHHTTYEHLGDELLFELISLCVECHEKIHPHMRANSA